MSSKNNFSKLLGALIIVLALSFSTSSYANGSDDHKSKEHKSEDKGDDDGSKDNGSKDGSTSVPLDGGLSILLLGAAAFGAKKLRDNKKQ